jgi:hypothetical protein
VDATPEAQPEPRLQEGTAHDRDNQCCDEDALPRPEGAVLHIERDGEIGDGELRQWIEKERDEQPSRGTLISRRNYMIGNEDGKSCSAGRCR